MNIQVTSYAIEEEEHAYEDDGGMMDPELAKLEAMTADAKTHEEDGTGESANNADGGLDDAADDEVNRRSIYVGNVRTKHDLHLSG